MSGGRWNRAGRRSGGARPFVLKCAAGEAENSDEIISALMGKLVEIEQERGIKIDWESQLPSGAASFSAREVVNAIGRALTSAGVPNNLAKEET